MSQERRRFQRVPETFPAQCRRSRSGEPWQEIQSLDISAGGLRFVSRLPFEQGEPLDFEMTLPATNQELKVSGAVVWTKFQAAGVVEIGVQFNRLTPDQEILIDEVVQFLMKKSRPMPRPSPGDSDT